ncbi:MAG: FKBP-type peptidyl-prolyl cis-trans isomerase, partial [Ferruginibacter sp.]
MKRILFCLSTFCILGQASQAQTKKPATPAKKPTAVKVASPMRNGVDSFSYAAGLNIAQSMKQQGVTNLNATLVQLAIDDVMKNRKPLLTEEQANMTLQEQLQAFGKKRSSVEEAKGKAFLDANKKRPGVITLANGLQYEVIKAGDATSVKPTAADTVVVNYKGTLIDGTEFDNSFSRGEPATFPVGGVIRGWTEILQLMPKGAHWKVYIPS